MTGDTFSPEDQGSFQRKQMCIYFQSRTVTNDIYPEIQDQEIFMFIYLKLGKSLTKPVKIPFEHGELTGEIHEEIDKKSDC